MHSTACLFSRSVSVGQSDARLTGDQEVAGLILPGRQQSLFSALIQEGQLSPANFTLTGYCQTSFNSHSVDNPGSGPGVHCDSPNS